MNFEHEYCSKCNNPASVKIITKEGKNYKVIYLCSNCYTKVNVFQKYRYPLPLYSIFKKFFEPTEDESELDVANLKCAECGTTFLEVIVNGAVKCPACYKYFEKELDKIFKKLQKNIYHVGKIPSDYEKEFKIKQNINILKTALKEAIEKEEFQKALSIKRKIEIEETKLKKLRQINDNE